MATSSAIIQLTSTVGNNSNNSCQCQYCPIISSALSSHVVAEQVMPFLERDEVLQMMALGQFCHRFQIHEYYCPNHGSKLENQQSTHNFFQFFGNDNKQKNNTNDNDNDNQNECEDCVHAGYGWSRCSLCDLFDRNESILTCSICNKRGCLDCQDSESVEEMAFLLCGTCGQWFCGDTECMTVASCDSCSSHHCQSCQQVNQKKCALCGDWHTCQPKRQYAFGYACVVCDFSFEKKL